MKKITAMPAGRQGFTLFELLVSISIIGILTAIAAVSYSSAQKKARDARRMEDMGNIQKAAEQYYSQNSYKYPTATGDFTTGSVLQSWPKDPKSGLDYVPQTMTVGGYCVCALLDTVTAGNSDNACNFTGGVTTHYCVKNQQ